MISVRRDVIVRLRPSVVNIYTLQRVPSTNSLYHLLHYVLLFPRGSEASTMRTPGVGRKRQDLTASAEITKLDFLKYHLHE